MNKKLSIVIFASLLSLPWIANAQEQASEIKGVVERSSSEGSQTDKYAVLDSVVEDGSNLRQVLAGLDIVVNLIPLGPNVTYIIADSGVPILIRGGVLDSGIIEFRDNIYRICRGEWTENVAQKDIMSDRVAIVKKTIPKDIMKNYFLRSSHYGWRKAWCGDVFSYEGSAQHAYIVHKVAQPFIWKIPDLDEPKSKDDLPPDGLVPKSWFKPKERYPDHLTTIAWTNRICELRGGQLFMAFRNNVVVGTSQMQQPVVVTKMEEILKQNQFDYEKNYYLYCDAGTESFLIRRYIELDVDKMAVQRNRDLKSVGF